MDANSMEPKKTIRNPVLRARNRIIPGFDFSDEGKWDGPFHFIQAADTQLGLIDRYLLHSPVPNWEKEVLLTRKAVEAANAMNPKPRFFIICGDLVDAFPEQEELRQKQTNDLLEIFQDLNPDIPLICVCGNHDLGDHPTPDSITKYQNVFGDDYFSFWLGGVLFLILNSQFYEDPSQVQQAAEEQDVWLDKQLEKKNVQQAKHVIIFQHIPWFLNDINEPKEYSNLVPALRLKYLDKFQSAGVSAIFCGHYHRNAGGRYKDVEVVVTSAVGGQLGNDKSGFRVVSVFEKTLSHQYFALEDVPHEINLTV